MIQNLASPHPALPTGASSLEASRAALESSISALESSIKASEGSSAGWENWAWACSIAVAVGVAAEILGIVWGYREEREAWGRGNIQPPDRPSVRKLWFELIAIVLVVVGVFGEARGSGALASINSNLRSKTSELRSKSEQLLALVELEAGNAATSADRAQGSAVKADTDAKEAKMNSTAASTSAQAAQAKASTVEQKATALDTQLGVEKAALNDLAVCNAPRVFDFWYSHGKSLLDSLAPYAGTEVAIRFMPDAESRRAALNIFSALKGAAWKPSPPTVLDGLQDGVSIIWYGPAGPNGPRNNSRRAEDAAGALLDFLHLQFWQARWRDNFSGEQDVPLNGIKILVGLYPARAYLTAQDEAEAFRKTDNEREREQAAQFKANQERIPAEFRRALDRETQPCRPLNDLVKQP
jgi:hypothetical protein